MSEIPDTVLGKIEYFEQHIPVWAADPTAIGLTAQQIADLTNYTAAARVAYNDTQALRSQAKASTLNQTTSVKAMMAFGTAVIATIKAFADINGNDQDVYVQAEITPDNTPAPLAPPVPATELRADLLNTGEIKLTWKGTVANGTFYSVWRKLADETNFDTLGSVSAKNFVDASVPQGTSEAVYYLVTHRDELSSEATEPIFVRFGVADGDTSGQNQTGDTGGLNIAA